MMKLRRLDGVISERNHRRADFSAVNDYPASFAAGPPKALHQGLLTRLCGQRLSCARMSRRFNRCMW